MKKLLLTTAAVTLLACNAYAIDTTADGSISATIVSDVSIEHINTTKLDFGTIMNKANSVTVDNAGNRTATNASYLVGNTASADEFTLKGPAGKSVTVTLPTQATVSNGSGGEMTVSTFTSDKSGAQTLDGTDLTVKVGGTLAVGANQAEGDYSGTYTVTVSY